MALPFIPATITVHLGAPDEPARNIEVPFIEYIKNVASSEIYPTWPESALRANILAQITFALNRIYTEFYRSQGYDFDITNSTRFDQAFIENRDYFENISKIVDEVFNDYIVKQGSVEPYFAQYCDGRNVMCEGLSQWGSVDLAQEGLIPYEILQNYYGNDINIMFDAPIQENIPSYSGRPIVLGDSGDEVLTIQREINRIADNYPAIPKISDENGFFNIQTEAAVKEFQKIFNLDQDGIVGKSTWYKIKFIYNSVKNLSELISEGLTIEEISELYGSELKSGDIGEPVRVVQYYLAVIAYFDDTIPSVNVDGIYDQNTKDGVLAFQKEYGLPQTGIVNRDTWNRIRDVYDYTLENIPEQYLNDVNKIFPGRFLTLGIEGNDVRALQEFLKIIYDRDNFIPNIDITGTFDSNTEEAVKIIQIREGLPVRGVVGPITWDAIVDLSEQLQQ